ncbi:hypothetical protein GIB67_036937 [Kingdonia uniflora]|uniref:Uncharacterized protein n=1 Tax=Kingdonia uniflora TaxID=39325 RepID=A0A7J7NVT9_9MAGN|nr:hypothetical protein GIB67_036937 [Kingdonia uniflora]
MQEEMAEKELEKQLVVAGTKLQSPPSGVEELLDQLDQVEMILARVEQSPPKALREALTPSMKALIADKLLRHSNMGVKVAVAACISEITRITAPDAPYNDEQMKIIFQLIVAAFEELFDTDSRLYSKRISILETVAKVRSCVVMLDLECDKLILEMFQHFLFTIRDAHKPNVFASMEMIMTMVLEESEDISPELLSCVLYSVKNGSQDVLPIAKRLGETVLRKCAKKLKPYMMQAVKSGLSLNDYSNIVTVICQETSDTIEHNDANVSKEHQADDRDTTEKDSADEPPQVVEPLEEEVTKDDPVAKESPKFLMSNGTAQTENADSVIHLESSQKKLEVSHDITQSVEAEHDNVHSSIRVETKPVEATKKKRGRKPNAVRLAEASAKSMFDSANKTVDPPVDEAIVPSGHGNEKPADISSPIASPTPSDSSRLKRGRKSGNKKSSTNQDVDPTVEEAPPSSKVTVEGYEDKTPPSSNTFSKKESDGLNESEAIESGTKDGIEDKTHKRSHKSIKVTVSKTPPSAVRISNKDSGVISESEIKESEGNIGKEKKPAKRSHKKAVKGAESRTMSSADVNSKKESASASDTEAKVSKRSDNTAGAKENESSAKKQGAKTNKAKGKAICEEGIAEESSDKELISTPAPVSKTANKIQKHSDKAPTKTSKRKGAAVKEGTHPESVKEFGENLLGSYIKVYWPDDKKYYNGTIDSFHPNEKKHKVIYDDEEEEILDLKHEVWDFVSGERMSEEGHVSQHPDDPSAEMSQKKKLKRDPDSAAKQTKTPASSKRGKGNSATKSKSAAKSVGNVKDAEIGSSNKSKDDSATKSKDETTKSGGSLKDMTSITGTKSKDSTPKTTSKSKGSTPKSGSASKDVTPKTSKSEVLKSGNKSSVNETPVAAKGKTAIPKEDESGDPASAKSAEECETKGAKRRRK